MPSLLNVEVEGIVTYKGKARLTFDAPVTVIRGKNKDRKGKDSANAVGKSLIVSMLPTIRYAAPPSAARKNSAKTAYQKGSVASFTFMRGTNKYKFVQQAHGQSLKLLAFKNNKDLGYRESGKARALLEKLIPISEDQFYTLYYLDTFRPSQLLKASAAQRFDLFENLFDIDVYDSIHKVVSKKYNELKLALQKADTLKEQLDEITASLPDLNIKKAKERKEKLEGLTEKYSRITEKAYTEMSYIAAYLAVARNDDDSVSAENIVDGIKVYAEKIEQLNKRKTRATKYHARLEDAKATKERAAVLKERLKKYNAYGEQDEARAVVVQEKTRSAERLLQTAKTNLEEQEALLVDIRSQAEFVDNKTVEKYKAILEESPNAVAKTNEALSVLRSNLKQFRMLSKRDTDDHSCPTCTQNVSATFVQENIDTITSKIEKLEKRVSGLINANSHGELLKAGRECKKLIATHKDEVEKYESGLKKLTKETEYHESAAKKAAIETALSELPTFDLGEEQPKPSTFDDKIKKAEGKLAYFKKLDDTRTQQAELEKTWPSVAAAKALKQELEIKQQELSPKLRAFNEELQSLSGNLANAKLLRSQKAKLEADIADEHSRAKDFDIYEKLREAYGAKGLRLIQIEAMAHEYIKGMNAMSHLIFPESIKFDYRISNGVFDIIATRSNQTSDVRFLSGSESRAFMLLSVLALLPFVPKQDRLDTLICDEIESGMDPTTQRLFVDEFLPVLNKLIPKIVIITPKSKRDFFIPNSKEVWVVKEKGISTLQ